uniref:Uncharacterized protein n=1 Tax=Fagus sylvatica TaxID=28930 RepID=A0A2N9GAB5_FAGSY
MDGGIGRIRCPLFQRVHVWTTIGITGRNFFVGVCWVAKREGKAICFGDLVPADCVLCRLLKELFTLAFPAINTWKLLRDRMASEGSSWHQVRPEELPIGLSDREVGGNSFDETPSVSGSSKGNGIPDLDERACSSKYDDVAFYEAEFQYWFEIPPVALYEGIVRSSMPFTCKGEDSLTVDEFLYYYKPYQIAVSLGFWTLNNRQKGMKLVTSLPTTNREWKDDYVFICGENWKGLPWEKKDDSFVRVHRAWGTPLTSGVVLHHRDHYYTNFIQPEVLALYSFDPEPNETVLSLQITNQRRMATAKLNKDKLKRMIGQKEAMPVNLGKKRLGDSASKLVSDEIMVRPPMIPESTPFVQIPTTSVKVIESAEIPSSSKVVDKAPTLALDPSLALRRVKSAVTKEDMDEYRKLNTDVVKPAPAHSLMKGLTEAMVIANRCMHWEDGIVKLKSQLTDTMDANKTSSSTTAELTREKNILTDELTRVGIESLMKDEELRRTTESYGKALDQLKALSEQLEPARLKSISHPMLVMTTIPNDDFVASVEERNEAVASVDPQLTDDATT